MTKRIIILISPYSSPKTGAHIRFDRLARYLSNQEDWVIWITPERKDIALGNNIEFWRTSDMEGKQYVSFRMTVWVFRYTYQLLRLRKKNTLLISFGETNVIPSGVVSFIGKSNMSLGIRSNFKKRYAVNKQDINNLGERIKMLLMPAAMFLWALIYRQADQVTVQTPQAKVDAVNTFGVSESKISIIENDLPISRVANHSWQRNSAVPKRALFVGDDTNVKGFDVLVKSISKFAERAPTVEVLTIVGVSNMAFNNLKKHAKKSGPKLISLKRTDKIISIMANHDLLIVPSREDQFPNLVLESLALGLPVIGSNVDGIAYIISDSLLLFKAGDADDLLQTLSNISTKAGYARACELIKERAEKFRFSWEKKYLDLLFKH